METIVNDWVRLVVRRLWVCGWAPTALADEDSQRSEQARTEEWTRAVTFLFAASAVDRVALGWVARWILQRDDRDAVQAVRFDVLDALQDMRLAVA